MESSEPSLAPLPVAVERRLHPRRLLSLEAQCLCLKPDALNTPLAQSTCNLGTRGAGLISDRPLDRGMMIMLTLLLPPASKRKIMLPEEICPAIECQKVAILSRVVWCLPWKGQHHYGVQFLDLERDQRARFKAYLLDLELDHQGSPWYV